MDFPVRLWRRIVRRGWTWMLVLFFPSSMAIAGPVAVVENYVLTDTTRGRQVPLKIYYPENPGLYPLIIFSHGSGGSKEGYEYLGRFWAENGYVVIHPTHIEIFDPVIIKSGPDSPAAKKIVTEDPLMNRPRDISFIIDSLPAITKALPELGDRMDPTRIGVAGHSAGAYTAMAIAGAIFHLPKGEIRTFGDSRVKAFIAMSPLGPGEGGFTLDSWASISSPMLTLSGTEDRIGVRGGDPSGHLLPFKYMPPGGKFHLTIIGVTHDTFGDNRLDGTPLHEFIKRVSLAFWEIALRKNERNAMAFTLALTAEGIADDHGVVTGLGAKAGFKSK